MVSKKYDYDDTISDTESIGGDSASADSTGRRNTLVISELDLNTLRPRNIKDDGAKYVIIGKPGSGKTTIIDSLLYSKKHIIPVAQVFSGSEDSNGHYCKRICPLFVFNNLRNIKPVEKFISRQKTAISYLENPWVTQIIDDCTEDPKILKEPVFNHIYKNGRHEKMMHILSLQYPMDVSPGIRTCIDGTFILRETSVRNRKILYENYAAVSGLTFKDFCYIMDDICEDYTALFINNRVQSSKLEDCIFYYRANPNKIPSGWRFGCYDFWLCNDERYDTGYRNPLIF